MLQPHTQLVADDKPFTRIPDHRRQWIYVACRDAEFSLTWNRDKLILGFGWVI